MSDESKASATSTRDGQKRSRTRAQILDSAMLVFAEMGFVAPTVADVAKAANVSIGTIYYHFADKHEIATAVCDRLRTGIISDIDELILPLESAALRIGVGVQSFFAVLDDDSTKALVIIHAVQDDPLFRESFASNLARDITLGVAQGAFDDAQVMLTSDLITGMLTAALRSRIEHRSDRKSEAFVSACVLRLLGMRRADVPDVLKQSKAIIERTTLEREALRRANTQQPGARRHKRLIKDSLDRKRRIS